jgi:hypothetical protein
VLLDEAVAETMEHEPKVQNYSDPPVFSSNVCNSSRYSYVRVKEIGILGAISFFNRPLGNTHKIDKAKPGNVGVFESG